MQVVVRVRPVNHREEELGGLVCLQHLSKDTLRVMAYPEALTFRFDHIAGEASDQAGIFRVAGQPVVENCLSGYNSCVFAYGQTGSGKTFTMLGPPTSTSSSYEEVSRFDFSLVIRNLARSSIFLDHCWSFFMHLQ